MPPNLTILHLILVLVTVFRYAEANKDFENEFQHTPIQAYIASGDSSYAYSQRSGSPTTSHACNTVTSVPSHLTFITRYGYYRKYTHAYGIPVVSSYAVSDEALKRACYVLRFLLADKASIRYYFYKYFGRAGVIGSQEGVTHIPEHSFLGSWWNTRSRGLGATLAVPVSTGAEENLLCWTNDRYRVEDIFLHEFSHGIQEIAITAGAIPGYNQRLQGAYNNAKYRGLWRNTYAMSTWKEYFAEGVQSYFNVNAYSATPNGIHNHVNTRSKLMTYDPTLYALIKEVFPCQNIIRDRCDQSGNHFTMKMDCDSSGGGRTDPPPTQGPSTDFTDKPEVTEAPTPTNCVDKSQHCGYWASVGECAKNPSYMKSDCCKSCYDRACSDKNDNCAWWASRGECTRNPGYMLSNCRKSCNVC